LYIRWSVPRKRIRGKLLAVRTLQPRLGHLGARKYLGNHRIHADTSRQVDILFEMLTF